MEQQCLNCKHLRPLSGGCDAFPDGIPYKFTSDEVAHDKPEPGQVGDFVFEKGEPEEMAKMNLEK